MTEACVISPLARNHNGYAIRKYKGRTYRAHRLAWMLEKGPIPVGFVIDHLCRNRACVNVNHMEVVTQRENVLRGIGAGNFSSNKTHCKRGHEFTDDNTLRDKNGGRHCKLCKAMRFSIYWTKNKDRINAKKRNK